MRYPACCRKAYLKRGRSVGNIQRKVSMKRTPVILIFLTMLMAISICAAHAGEPAEVELVDGSVVYGKVVSLKNGIYTIKSDSMGTFVISKSKIRAIRFRSQRVNKGIRENPQGTDKSIDVQGIQKSLLADQDIFKIILSLQNDPEIQKILNDLETMKAVQSGDIQSLMSNPKFMELLNNPKIKAINKKVAK